MGAEVVKDGYHFACCCDVGCRWRARVVRRQAAFVFRCVVRLLLLAVLAVVGVLCVTAGVALIYPPAALIVFGAACVAVALRVEVRET